MTKKQKKENHCNHRCLTLYKMAMEVKEIICVSSNFIFIFCLQLEDYLWSWLHASAGPFSSSCFRSPPLPSLEASSSCRRKLLTFFIPGKRKSAATMMMPWLVLDGLSCLPDPMVTGIIATRWLEVDFLFFIFNYFLFLFSLPTLLSFIFFCMHVIIIVIFNFGERNDWIFSVSGQNYENIWCSDEFCNRLSGRSFLSFEFCLFVSNFFVLLVRSLNSFSWAAFF